MRRVSVFLRRHLPMILAVLVLLAIVVVLWIFSAPIAQRGPPGGGVPLGRSPMGGDPRRGPPGKPRHDFLGSVLDLDLMALDRQSEFVSIDKQSNDDVMHLNRFGKADRLACQALDART
jgi:hypothetical protein